MLQQALLDVEVPPKENRTRRFMALFQPTLYARAEAIAKRQRRSVNDVLNEAVQRLLDERDSTDTPPRTMEGQAA